MIIVSRIIHVKVDRRLNVTNKFKYQRRHVSWDTLYIKGKEVYSVQTVQYRIYFLEGGLNCFGIQEVAK